MQRKVLMPTSVPTLQPKVKHNSTPSISQSFQFGTDVISFSMPKLNMNTSQNTICSSDLEKNTTTADAPNKQLSRNFKDITNNQDTIPPKAAKSKKHLKHEKCHLLEKKLRSEIFRLKIRCSRLEDTVANFENKIKQQVEECFVTRANTVGNVARDVQNLTSSINASSRTDQRPVKDPLVGSAKHFTEDGNTTNSSTPPPETSIDDPQKIEVKSELTEEVMLDEPAEKVAEDNLFVNSTISPPEISTDPLHNAKANLTQCSIRVVDAETSRNVTENNRYPLTTSSAENSNSRRCSTEDPLEQHFEEVTPPEPGNSDEDSQSPNATIPSSEKSLENRNETEVRPGCSRDQENSGQGLITRSAKKRKHLPSVKKPTQNSDNVSNKAKVQMRNSLPYCCDICGTRFSNKRDWTRHKHQNTKPFHCQVCDKQFPSIRSLIAHGATHSEKKPFKCRTCDAQFKYNVSKLKHERVHKEGACFECAGCGKKFTYKHNLITHLRVHSGVKPFSCQTCGKSFADKSNLTTHQRTHTNEKPFKCRICNQGFKHNHEKWKHERVHVKGAYFECTVCGKKFADERNLIIHQTRLHSGVKPFSCQTCSKRFADKSYLTKHQRVHSEEKPFKCRICDARFKYESSKLVHERVHVKGACFECTVCGKNFPYERNLIRHQTLHSGVKPFSCQTCSKSFAQKGELTVHQRTHTKEKPFKCRICNKQFSQQGHKTRHERIHVEGLVLSVPIAATNSALSPS